MNRESTPVIALLLASLISACSVAGDGDSAATAEVPVPVSAPEVSFKPAADPARTAKPGGPVAISYRIIGTPIVGQPLAIELEFASLIGPQPISISYRVNDATALQFPESQPTTVSMAALAKGERGSQQVSVIPMREGRLYLNVAAHIEADNGSMSSVTAIPIQVGAVAREAVPASDAAVDDKGESIRSLPAKEN